MFFINYCNGQHNWLGNIGDFDDPSQWDQGTVPGPTDDIFIDKGTLIFPANGVYSFHTITALTSDAVLDFRGNFSSAANVEVYGDVILEDAITIIYESGSSTSWEFMGSEVNHELETQGNDLNNIILDVVDSQLELKTDLFVSRQILIKKGFLDGNGETINCGTFRVGGGCSSPDCPNKNIDFEGGTVICSTIWSARFNYGSFALEGTHHIKAPQFEGGTGVEYNQVTITDYESQSLSPLQDHNLLLPENTFDILNIDNIYESKIAGDLTVLQELNVIQPNSEILITSTTNRSSSRWSLNGEVNLPVPTTGCPGFTVFTRYRAVADTFSFHTIQSDLVFDNAIIRGIPTSGGGSFTVNNGYVAGYNADWNIDQPLITKTLYWIGENGAWEDGDNWSLTSGGSPYNCTPNVNDNVVFDENSFTDDNQSVILSYDKSYNCRNFNWQSISDDANISDISFGTRHPSLTITGSVDISMPSIFNFDGATLVFSGNDEYTIESESIIPKSTFTSQSAGHLLNDDVTFEFIFIEAGYFSTEGYDLNITNHFVCNSNQPKSIIFSNSNIDIGDIADFGDSFSGNVNIFADGSIINCADFSSVAADYNVVNINGSGNILQPYGITFNKLELTGVTFSMFGSGIDVDSLIINTPNHGIRVLNGSNSRIESIVCNIPVGTTGEIRAISGSASIEFAQHNSCLLAPIEWTGISAQNTGQLNVPNSVDGGNNSGFSFLPVSSYSGSLHWIGANGNMHEQTNWSNSSGGCPTSTNPTAANQLIFDTRSFVGLDDTVVVTSAVPLNKVLWQDLTNPIDLVLANNMNIEEMVVDNSQVRQSSSVNGSVTAEHHIHVINDGKLNVFNSNIMAGWKSNTLTESTFFIERFSEFSASNSLLTLRGQAPDLSLPTLHFGLATNIDVQACDLLLSHALSGNSVRDMTLEANNEQFQFVNIDILNGGSKTVFLKESLRCNEITTNFNKGNLEVMSGAALLIME